VIAGAWRLSPAPNVAADGPQVSQTAFQTNGWLDATVPGTVLTTFVNSGIYPDPDYGLNNLAIPETLNKQEYWYRTEFAAPASVQKRRWALTFSLNSEIRLKAARQGSDQNGGGTKRVGTFVSREKGLLCYRMNG
jgi:hypothetical protein